MLLREMPLELLLVRLRERPIHHYHYMTIISGSIGVTYNLPPTTAETV